MSGDPCAAEPIARSRLPEAEATWRLFGGEGTLAELFALEVRFDVLRREVLAGARPWNCPDLLATARALRLEHPARHDRRPPRVAAREVPDGVLADIAEDLLPDLAVRVEQVEGADANDGGPTGVAAAVLACVEMTERRRPLDAWSEEEPDRALVIAARVVAASPPGLFLDGQSLLPRPERLAPTGEAPSGCVVARPYRVEGEGAPWRWAMVRRLPRVPDARVVRRRMMLALWELRLQDRRHTFEDALRVHADVLYRASLEAAGARVDSA